VKAVVLAKASSTRVPNKNFRPFHGDDSLLDIALAKLVRVVDRSDIYVSCEDAGRAVHAERWGVNFSLRSPDLVDNDVPQPDVVRGVCASVSGADDVMWCQLTDPLFDDYAGCLAAWEREREEHDSLVVVYPRKLYLLDEHHRPLGFGFGPWHIPSQRLPLRYQLPFTLMILPRETIDRVGYYVGAKPLWYEAPNVTVDIDTEDDFDLAQAVYAYYASRRTP
jgi:N-acylneuraminate cytidylyltransferase